MHIYVSPQLWQKKRATTLFFRPRLIKHNRKVYDNLHFKITLLENVH